MKIVLQICCIKVTCLLSRAFSTNHSNSPSISTLSFAISLNIYFAMTTEHHFSVFSSPKCTRNSSTVNMRENIWDLQKQGTEILFLKEYNSYVNVCITFYQMFILYFFFEETEPHKWVNIKCSKRTEQKNADVDVWVFF